MDIEQIIGFEALWDSMMKCKRGVMWKDSVAGFCLDACFEICKNLKIDTHRDNIPMQRALAKHGFRPCGTVYLENGDARVAYQKSGE